MKSRSECGNHDNKNHENETVNAKSLIIGKAYLKNEQISKMEKEQSYVTNLSHKLFQAQKSLDFARKKQQDCQLRLTEIERKLSNLVNLMTQCVVRNDQTTLKIAVETLGESKKKREKRQLQLYEAQRICSKGQKYYKELSVAFQNQMAKRNNVNFLKYGLI